MAKLIEPSNGFQIGSLAPTGTYVATCLAVDDQFGVDRPKFENPSETEKIDVTRFLFGFKGTDGQTYKVQSFEFRISGSPKSNLFKLLTSWLGRSPEYGWDYCELKGKGAQITVAHKQSRDGTRTYANLGGVSPVIDQLKDQVLPIEAFDGPDEQDQSGMQTVNSTSGPKPPAQPQTTASQPWNPTVDSQQELPF